VLTLAGVHASYGSSEVLHGIDLQLAAGECLALVGESGSGKTTLARTIAGMHRERQGRTCSVTASSPGAPARVTRTPDGKFSTFFRTPTARSTRGKASVRS